MEDQNKLVQSQEDIDSPPIATALHEPERRALDQMPGASSKETRGISKLAKTVVIVSALLLFAFILLLSRGISLFSFGRTTVASTGSVSTQGIALVAGSAEKFNYLSQQRTNTCGLQSDVVLTYADDMRIQGSCCSPMDLGSYQAQVEGLKRYSDIAQIPSDPYDIPASLAKELLGYQTSIQLTPDQQAIYDQAMTLSHEGGPCCCRCWRWYAYEGMAKYLITQRGWNAQQVAELWDLADGCGGPRDENG